MVVPILILAACELELTLTAAGLGLAMRSRPPAATLLATGLISIGFASAMFAIWVLWFVAPACVAAASACARLADLSEPVAFLATGAVLQWAWLSGFALAFRRLKGASAGTRGLRVAE